MQSSTPVFYLIYLMYLCNCDDYHQALTYDRKVIFALWQLKPSRIVFEEAIFLNLSEVKYRIYQWLVFICYWQQRQ